MYSPEGGCAANILACNSQQNVCGMQLKIGRFLMEQLQAASSGFIANHHNASTSSNRAELAIFLLSSTCTHDIETSLSDVCMKTYSKSCILVLNWCQLNSFCTVLWQWAWLVCDACTTFSVYSTGNLCSCT